MSNKKSNRANRLTFAVDKHWKFLTDNYGMEEAMRFFGPYRGASISPQVLDEFTIEVTMPLVVDNTNYVGTQFGGSLYSMCDPFFMFILMNNLGEDYMVWDKSAKIDFIRPGRSKVVAKFNITKEEIEKIKSYVDVKRKTTQIFIAKVFDTANNVVAIVEKELYIRRISKII